MLRANWALLCGSGRGSLVVMTCTRSLICQVFSPSGPIATHAGLGLTAPPSLGVAALSSVSVDSDWLSAVAEVDASLAGLAWALWASALSGAAPILAFWPGSAGPWSSSMGFCAPWGSGRVGPGFSCVMGGRAAKRASDLCGVSVARCCRCGGASAKGERGWICRAMRAKCWAKSSRRATALPRAGAIPAPCAGLDAVSKALARAGFTALDKGRFISASSLSNKDLDTPKQES